jgi:CubicO group peptidase (beta-lactamase class C family)
MGWAELIRERAQQQSVPGVAAGVVDATGVRWATTHGVTDEPGASITPRTIFSVQSISKLYTATCVLCAVRHGILDLDAPIRTYLPNFNVRSMFEDDPAAKMTLRLLLSHKAGFTHEAPLGNNHDGSDVTYDEHVASIPDTWLRFRVGERYEYSNLGIDVAGYALQAASGLPFAEFARLALFEPLGMDDTTFDRDVIKRSPDRATGHDPRLDTVPLNIPIVPSGGLYTSLSDALRFVQFWLRDAEGILTAELLAEQRRIPLPVRGQRYGYGLGLAMTPGGPIPTDGHNGGGFGFLAELCWNRELGLGGVVLTNSTGHGLIGTVVRALAEEAGAERAPRPAVAGRTLSMDRLERFCGTYVGRGSNLVLDVHEDHFALRVGEERKPLEFVSQDEAILPIEEGGRVRFEPGRVIALADGSCWLLNHRPDDPHTDADPRWREYESDYEVALIWPMPIATFAVRRGRPCWRWSDGLWLRLREHEPGLFFTCHGEALDLRGAQPSYANIKLRRVDDGLTPEVSDGRRVASDGAQAET